MSSTVTRKIDQTNDNVLDIFENNLSTVSVGLENVTGNYVIGRGNDFLNPYFTIDTNNGDITVANNLLVKGTTTISNTSSVSLETTNLSVGLKNNTGIKNMKQVTNTNYPNYQQYANIYLDTFYPFSNTYNIKFNGISTSVGGVSKNYNIVYSGSSFTNIYGNLNLISNSAKNNNNNNFGFTDNTSPIFNQTNNITDLSFYFKSNFPVHLGATLTNDLNSSSSTINVNNTNGWDSSGNLLIAPNSATSTVTSGVTVNSGSTNDTLVVSNGSLFSVGDYVAGTKNNGDLFVLGQIVSKSSNTLTFSTYIPGSISSNSNVYKLYNIVYTSKTPTSFTGISLVSLGSNTISVSIGNYLQIFNTKSVIGSSNLYYFNNGVSANAPYVVSISTVESDSTQTNCPIFDNSPPDLQLVGNQFFTLQFDPNILTPVVANFTFNPSGLVGELQSNTTNDGLFSLDFEFTDANNVNSSKSICVGSVGNSATSNQDSIYFTKIVNNSPATFFSLDYGNNRLQFKNGADIQNNVANQLLLNATTSTKVTSTTNSTSSSSGALIVAGGMGINNDVFIGGSENVSGVLKVTNSTTSTDASTGAVVVTGGVGIGGIVNITGNENLAGVLNVTNSTVSSSANTGAVVVTGGVGIGGAVNITGNENLAGVLNVTNSTVSSSASTGAVVVTGGVGIGGAVNITGNENLAGVLKVTNSTASTDSSSGAVVVTGGVGIGGVVNINGNENLAGVLKVTNSTVSTDASSGAVVVTGGVGIGGVVNITGNENLAGVLKVTNSTASTDASSGAVVVTGGVGIGGVVNITGNENLAGVLKVTNSTASTDASTGAVVVTGGVGIGGVVNITGNENLAGVLNVTNSTASTDASSGAVVVTGGVGIGGAVNITGNENIAGLLKITNSTQSTSSTNGSIITNGGLGVAKDVFVGGKVNIKGTITTQGGFTVSDKTLKTDIETIDNALNKVLNINGVYFNWIDKEKFNDKHQVGFLAQNIEEVVPELVHQCEDGIKVVNYNQMVAVLVEAMKEQNNIINQLKADVEMLKQKKTRTRKPKSNSDSENSTESL